MPARHQSEYDRWLMTIGIAFLMGCGSTEQPAATNATTSKITSATKTTEILMPTSANWTSEVHQDPPPLPVDKPSQNSDSPRRLATFSGPSNGFADVAMIDQGQQLVLPIRRTNVVKVWDTVTGREAGIIQADPGMVFRALVSDDGSLVAIGMNNKTIELWDLVSRRRNAILKGQHQRGRRRTGIQS